MKTILNLALLSTLALATIAKANTVPELRCFGTEPFWAVSTDSKGFLSYSDMGSDTKKFYSKTTMKSAEGTSGLFAFQVEAEDMAKNILKLNVVQSECNDGMSDNVYPYTTLVDVDGSILMGCCE